MPESTADRQAGPGGTDEIVLTRSGEIATLWLNRPHKRNALTYEMWVAIATTCAELRRDARLRVLVVRGAEGHFCAGADIGELGAREPSGPGDFEAATRAVDDALATFPRPTIAHISGSCAGGGAQIAVACDVRIADATARISIPPARLGIVYPEFALERLVRLVGPSAAKLLLYSAEAIDAERALRIGLVDEVHEPAAASQRVTTLAELIAGERSLLTQLASKEMVDSVSETGSVDPSIASRWAAEVAASTDAREGRAAFFERRTPRFDWRPPA